MNLEDVDSIVEGLMPALAVLVKREVVARTTELPKPERGEKGDPGRDGVPGLPGKDGMPGQDGAPGRDAVIDTELLARTVTAEVTRAVAEIPRPQDGAPGEKGEPGKDAEVDYERIEAHAKELIAAIPVPKDGAPGEPGKDGEPGKSVTVDEVRPLAEDWLSKAFAEMADEVVAGLEHA